MTNQVFFTRLNQDGLEPGSDIRVTHSESTASFSSSPSPMVWTGSEYGLAWKDNRDGAYNVYFARLDSFGMKIGDDLQISNTPHNSESESIVWTGSEFGLIWSTKPLDENEKIFFTRLDSTGVKVGGDVVVVESESSGTYPLLAWSGSEYAVLWNLKHSTTYRYQYSDLYFTRLNASGERIGPDRLLNDCIMPQHSDVIYWNGNEYVMILSDSWRIPDEWDLHYEVFLLRVNEVGEKLGAPFRLTHEIHEARGSDLALNGNSYAVIWKDDRDSDSNFYFTLVGCD